jgi:hypothetical protein
MGGGNIIERHCGQKMVLAPRHPGAWLFEFKIQIFKKYLYVDTVYTIKKIPRSTLLCRLSKKEN